MHQVSEPELDGIAAMGASIHLGFLGIGLGALISFGIVLSTTVVPDPKTYAAYVALFALSGVLSLYFGIRGVADYRESRRKLTAIKSGAA